MYMDKNDLFTGKNDNCSPIKNGNRQETLKFGYGRPASGKGVQYEHK